MRIADWYSSLKKEREEDDEVNSSEATMIEPSEVTLKYTTSPLVTLKVLIADALSYALVNCSLARLVTTEAGTTAMWVEW
jgi:hypothetical protein